MNAKAFDPAPAGFTFVIDTLYLYGHSDRFSNSVIVQEKTYIWTQMIYQEILMMR